MTGDWGVAPGQHTHLACLELWSSPVSDKPRVVAHTCKPSTWDMDTGGPLPDTILWTEYGPSK